MFPLPPLAKQVRIVAETERRFSLVEELGSCVEVNRKRSSWVRETILWQAFVGEL
jgi:hypothetical protein